MPKLDRRFLFLLASARPSGNTELLARRAASALPEGVRQHWLRLAEHPLPPFVDHRHGSQRFPEPKGVERLLLDATLEATDIVFVTPLYWYSLPSSAKLYRDYWSAWMRTSDGGFLQWMSGKTTWVVTTVSGENAAAADPMINALRLTADYARMRWGGLLVGHGDRPGDVLTHAPSLAAANVLFGEVGSKQCP